ncbi:hypothetical protein [Streptomyces hesseae]|uniref:Uncharacterized protein n=1 Tax=Streptomyces hesseae TaxID=3075519 RepID=A0ABU2SPI4_9ACTN|nr:hypothetical protein [Streptomyces sp. DSM 40473]MDT0449960.1 hypothetical protein [Streptomyces sp. DSM 40473]
MPIDDNWKPEYDELARSFLRQHFGWPPKLAFLYPSMRVEYPWGAHRPPVVDSRVHAKNNEEYHGLERHAWQYHATVQYAESYQFFLMAAAWRLEDAELMGVSDAGHSEAIRYCVRHALFNRALAEKPMGSPWPAPEEFGIDPDQHQKRVQRAEEQMRAVIAGEG